MPDLPTPPPEQSPPPIDAPPPPRSLRELIDRVTGRHMDEIQPRESSGIADIQPFPFLAIVGQKEMKLALVLALINPAVGGVLLVGPRGTGKTTAVRSLSDLLPQTYRSLCYYGCMPEDVQQGGVDAICPACAKKYAAGELLAAMDKVRLIELPLNARLEDVVGKMDERTTTERFHMRRGVLTQADRNLLYIDEVNLLPNEIVDAILDAAAQGHFTVRRGLLAATYHARFVLVGSMNPEEGQLRSQIMDRFGLRLLVRGLDSQDERLEAYRRVQAYRANSRQVNAQYAPDTEWVMEEIQAARTLLPNVKLPDTTAALGLQLVNKLGIASLRAEITLFEAARAHAAADGREAVTPDDLQQVAPMALRLRRSEFMQEYFVTQSDEEEQINQTLAGVLAAGDEEE